MKKLWKGIGWGVLVGATMYFFVGAIYWVGFKNGKQSVKCDRAQCMSYIIKYSK